MGLCCQYEKPQETLRNSQIGQTDLVAVGQKQFAVVPFKDLSQQGLASAQQPIQ